MLLKEWAYVSVHPPLPEIVRELQFLERIKDDAEDSAEIDQKIDILTKKYNDEKLHFETMMKQIILKNNELKEIRKKTGMETVPWKIHVKEFDVQGRPSYDIGVTPVEVGEKVVSNSPADVEAE